MNRKKNFLKGLLYPDSSLELDEKEKEKLYKVNLSHFISKMLAWTLWGLFLFFVKAAPLGVRLINFTLTSLLLLVFLTVCRTNPRAFEVSYAFITATYGPLCGFVKGGLIYSIASTFINPLLILFRCENENYSLIALTASIIYYYFKTESDVMELLERPSTELLTSSSYRLLQGYILILFSFLFVYGYLSRKNLRRQALELKMRSRAKKESLFLNLSHELRNPLNSIMGCIQLALFEEIPLELKKTMENAQLCGEHLLHLINNILDSGKVDAGELDVHTSPTDMYTLCERVWKIADEFISRKGLIGFMKISKNVPRLILTDNYRITQIMLNLIGNAAKFTDKGTISIRVDWIHSDSKITNSAFEPIPFNDEEEAVFEKEEMTSLFSRDKYLILSRGSQKFQDSPKRKSFSNQEGILKISVIDSGCGIQPDDLPKVFTRFYQVENEISKRKIGIGLGLFITKEICNKLGGEIRVFSRPGKGSCFIVCIPAKEMELGSHSDETEIENSIPPLYRRCKALVTDDIKLNVEVIISYLKMAGVRNISYAENGLVAFQMYKRSVEEGSPINFITMDYDMPVMDGKEAIKRIRELEHERGLSPCLIAMVSGHCSQTIIDECLDPQGDVRANLFFKKPLTFEQLNQVLQNVGFSK